MTKKLKCLSEFNNQRCSEIEKFMEDRKKPKLNGIACPKCGKEMYDSNPMFTLSSNPPQKNIHCDNCKYKGYRYV